MKRDLPEIRKLEIAASGVCPITAVKDEPGVPKLTQIFLIKSYWTLQNVVTTLTVFELLRENQPLGKIIAQHAD